MPESAARGHAQFVFFQAEYEKSAALLQHQAAAAIVRTVLELSGGQAAVALDISEPMPSLLLKRDGPRVMLGLLNWTDESRPVGQGLARTSRGLPDRLADVWTGRRFSVSQLPSVQLAPHSGLLLMAD